MFKPTWSWFKKTFMQKSALCYYRIKALELFWFFHIYSIGYKIHNFKRICRKKFSGRYSSDYKTTAPAQRRSIWLFPERHNTPISSNNNSHLYTKRYWASQRFAKKQKRDKHKLVSFLCKRRPIFPGRRQPSIFGTRELNFCVRDGNRWTLTVIGTYFAIYYCAKSTMKTEQRGKERGCQNKKVKPSAY